MSEKRLRLALGLVAAAGVGVAGYLTWVHYDGTAPVCLAGGGGCERVQTSPYAVLGPLPVAAWGLGFYLCVLSAASARGEIARWSGLGLGLIGVGVSAYLTYLELFVIEAICQWCVASALLSIAVCALTAWRVWRYSGPGVDEDTDDG